MIADGFIDILPKGIAEMPISIPHVILYRVHKRRDEALPEHAHGQAQLTFAISGMVQLRTEDGIWLLPPQLAAWIPPDIPHRLDIMTNAELWILLWDPATVRAWQPETLPSQAFISRVSPLLRSLLEAVAAMDALSERRELALRLILHELQRVEDAPTFLPMPTSQVGLRVAELALADHRNALDLDTLASQAATSVRTASRRFPEETGMTLKAWRQRARILWTLTELGRGKPIARAARDAGFASTAAFSHAFRQVMALTPSEFLSLP
ncbi:helix-turn-helix transcriptional regulator [Pseudomonas sp. GX19020]|uniref:AraC family transcriptional regulator n=1 Tax=Pseudomonadota TaxID=1224 RepID=UPI002018E0AD|nr:helix-turn-helix transcriptional regulator [Rhodobacter sp. 24-YEA-8]MCL4068341.1 helix-turn-helix transcriptional regulator [Pseudomonas sp. GX19020]